MDQIEGLVAKLVEVEKEQGEEAYGPNFVGDLRLFKTPQSLLTDAPYEALYSFVCSVYRDQEDRFENLCWTLERHQTSEYWKAQDADSLVTTEGFLTWFQTLFLDQTHYQEDGAALFAEQRERVIAFAHLVHPLVFESLPSITAYSLTDVNNENTPFGARVLVGSQYSLLILQRWIL